MGVGGKTPIGGVVSEGGGRKGLAPSTGFVLVKVFPADLSMASAPKGEAVVEKKKKRQSVHVVWSSS